MKIDVDTFDRAEKHK